MADPESMVERVARAICEARGINPENPTGRRIECDPDKADNLHTTGASNIASSRMVRAWEQFEDHARAALEAMREPTEEMFEVGFGKGQECSEYHGEDLSERRPFHAIRNVWQTMIDRALKDG